MKTCIISIFHVYLLNFIDKVCTIYFVCIKFLNCLTALKYICFSFQKEFLFKINFQFSCITLSNPVIFLLKAAYELCWAMFWWPLWGLYLLRIDKFVTVLRQLEFTAGGCWMLIYHPDHPPPGVSIVAQIRTCHRKLFYKGRIQSKKNINFVEFSTPGSDPPLPPGGVEKYNLFFLSFWHHCEQLWSKPFFPLEKVKNT